MSSTFTQIFIADKHLALYKSGADNGDDNLGGKISANEIDYISLHAVFPMISEDEAQDGNRDFHCLYLKNKSGLTVKGTAVFSQGTKSSSTHMRVGADAQGVGDGITTGKAQRIANKNTTPANVFFTEGTVRTDPQVLLLPDIPAYKSIPLWFERSNIFNANSEEDDNYVIVFDTANIVGDTGIALAPGTDTTVITGQTEVNDQLNRLNNLISLESILNNFFFLGNATSGSDATAWINNLSKFPILTGTSLTTSITTYLKDILRFVWGQLDVSNIPKRNQLITGIDPRAAAGYQYIVSKNVAYITIDTSGYQAYINPSAQYNKIVSYLDSANKNPNVDFIVVMTSKAPYGQLPDNDPVNPADPTIQKVNLDSEFRKHYHPLFTQYGVHLVVSSGINNYQRCHVLGYNESATANPTPFLTDKAPNYEIAAGAKNFGATGSIYINTTSGTKKPIHNVPTANVQTYVHKTVIPTGVLYLKIYSTQRTLTVPPILDAFLYEYHYPVTVDSVSTEPLPIKETRDHFSIRYLA
jgi:hypothetical protein